MEKIDLYEKYVIEILNEITTDTIVEGEELHEEILIDTKRRHYCLIWLGFEDKNNFMDKILVHFQIRADGKIWILANLTEHEIAPLLTEKGVAYQDIVIGFRPKYVRAMTKYSVG